VYSGAEVAVRAWSGVAPPKKDVDHSEEEGRAAGKDCPTRNVEVLNTRRIMHLFSDRLKSETTYQSAASFSCMPARAGETQRSGNHPNARSVPLTIWKIVPDTFIGDQKGGFMSSNAVLENVRRYRAVASLYRQSERSCVGTSE
jgi:hypothetical protein